MAHSDESNGALDVLEDEPRLNLALLDELMGKQGAYKKAEQARRFRVDCTHYFTIRSGQHVPSLRTAMRMARVAETTVEKLFGRAA